MSNPHPTLSYIRANTNENVLAKQKWLNALNSPSTKASKKSSMKINPICVDNVQHERKSKLNRSCQSMWAEEFEIY